jgi:hypothetical protein
MDEDYYQFGTIFESSIDLLEPVYDEVDSEDLMDWMIETGNMKFNENGIVSKTTHKSYTWDEYIKNPSNWIMNHPTLCYRKQSLIDVGNYRNYYLIEDLNLELRMLKKYKKIYNFDIPLLYYILHSNQVSNKSNEEEKKKLKKMIYDLITYD